MGFWSFLRLFLNKVEFFLEVFIFDRYYEIRVLGFVLFIFFLKLIKKVIRFKYLKFKIFNLIKIVFVILWENKENDGFYDLLYFVFWFDV